MFASRIRSFPLIKEKMAHFDVVQTGFKEMSDILSEALIIQWRHGFPQLPKGMKRFTHGFHPYMAGMNPALARLMIPLLLNGTESTGGGAKTILDPFSGSGTVVTEGTLFGVRSIGVDISPLATFISSHQNWRATDSEISNLQEKALLIAEKVTPAKTEGLKAWGPICKELYLTACEEAENPNMNRDDMCRLWFCASAAIARMDGQYKKDSVSLFLSSVNKYCQSVLDFSESIPDTLPYPNTSQFILSCMRDSKVVIDLNEGSQVDVVLTSPPYPGIYDYVSHARQHRVLLTKYSKTNGRALPLLPSSPRLHSSNSGAPFSNDLASLSRRCFIETPVPTGRDWGKHFSSEFEIGAHRAMLRRKKHIEVSWSMDEQIWLHELGRTLKRGGLAALLIGDHFGDFDGLASLRSSLLKVGSFLEVASSTIQSTGKYRGPGNRRTEHFVLLQKR